MQTATAISTKTRSAAKNTRRSLAEALTARALSPLGSLPLSQFAAFQDLMTKLMGSWGSQLQMLSVVAALMLGATHVHTIGRPIPWRASEDFTESFGAVPGTAMLVTAYTLNLACELLAFMLLASSCY